jgi:hypothetical protein
MDRCDVVFADIDYIDGEGSIRVVRQGSRLWLFLADICKELGLEVRFELTLLYRQPNIVVGYLPIARAGIPSFALVMLYDSFVEWAATIGVGRRVHKGLRRKALQLSKKLDRAVFGGSRTRTGRFRWARRALIAELTAASGGPPHPYETPLRRELRERRSQADPVPPKTVRNPRNTKPQAVLDQMFKDLGGFR